MEKVPHSVADEIRRRESLGNYYLPNRISIKKVLDDLEKLCPELFDNRKKA